MSRAFILASTLAIATMSLASEPDPPQPVVRPLTAIAVTRCNLLIVAYITLPDGSLVRYDLHSGVPISAVLTLVESAIHHEQADLPCEATT